MKAVSDPVLDGASMLDAVPKKNLSVRTDRTADGALVLRVPLEQKWFMRPPFSWIMPLSRERAVALDRIGEEVWQLCNGARTVEEVTETFATRHRLSFHESRLSVGQFLRDLIRRGLLVVVVPRREEGE